MRALPSSRFEGGTPMQEQEKPLSWLAIILILVAAAVVTGLGIGALGTVVELPNWLPGAALAAVVGALAPHLIARRNARIASAAKRS